MQNIILNDKGFKPKSIFFSYGHDENQEIVERLKDDLEKRGHNVWLDISKIRTWDDWRGSITEGIHKSNMAIAFISFHSVRESSVCRNEISMALQHFGKVYPVLVEAVPFESLPILLTTLQFPNLSDWKKKRENDPDGFERFYSDCLQGIVEKIEGECSRLSDEVDFLKKVLQPANFNENFSQHLNGFVGRDWIFEEFNQWLSQTNSRVFWLKAGPGFGKTALSVQLIKKMPKIFVANWFCNHEESRLSDPIFALKTIAFQLSLKFEDYRQIMVENFKTKDSDKNKLKKEEDLSISEIIKEQQQKLSKLSLSELFRDLLSGPLGKCIPYDSNYLILIDALDEAQATNGNNPLASLINSRLSQLPSWIKFVLTSRPDDAVTIQLQKFYPHKIDPNDYRNQSDLKQYIQQHILTLPVILDWDFDKKTFFMDHLIDKSGGMILYLRLLQEGYKEKSQDPDDIENIPNGLEGFYQQLFVRLFPEQIQFDFVTKLLGLLICSFEPMTKLELEEALEIEEGVLDKCLQDLSQILVKNPREGDPKSLCFTLFHKSVFDWLTKGGHPFFVSKKTAKIRIAKYCKEALTKNIKGVSHYARRHSVAHLMEIEDFQTIDKVLFNFDFIEERARFYELRELLADFELRSKSIPEVIGVQKELETRKEKLRLWVLGENKDLIPQSVYLWPESQIENFRQSINEDDLQHRILDFYNFVATQSKFLERYSDVPGFVIQQAFSHAQNGPVHQSAKKEIVKYTKPLLLRDWTGENQFNPANPCIQVYELKGNIQNSSLAVDWCQNILLVGRRDSSVILIDLQSGVELQVLNEHRNQVTCAVFSFDGTIFATGSRRSICIWGTQSGVLIKNFNKYPDWTNAIVSISNTHWVSGGNDGKLCWWSLDPEAIESCIQINAHATSILALAYAPGGSFLVSSSIDGIIKVWSKAGDCLQTLNSISPKIESPIHSISLSYDGAKCLVGHQNGHISYWDIPNGKCLKVLKGHDQRVYGLSMTPDGLTAASCSADSTVRVWALDLGECTRVLYGHAFQVHGVSISPWGDEVLSSSKDGKIIRWSIEKRSCFVSKSVIREEVTSLKELDDGRIISGHKKGNICIHHQTSLMTNQTWTGHEKEVWDLDLFNGDKNLISGSFDGDLKIWSLDSQKEIYSENFGKLYVTSISKSSSTLLIAGANKEVSYLPLDRIKLDTSGGLINQISQSAMVIPKAHRATVRSAVCSFDGQIIYSCSEDKLIKVWNAQDRELIQELAGHEDFVYTVALSPDGLRLASGGKDRSIRIWNLETNTCEKIMQGHDRAITGIWFTKDGRRLCSISWDETFRVWDIRSGKIILIFAFTGLSQALIIKNKKQVILGSAIGDVLRINAHCFPEGF